MKKILTIFLSLVLLSLSVVTAVHAGTGDPVTNLDAVTTSPSSTAGTYTLLAPIGKVTSIQTNDIGSYFNLIFKIAIGLCGAIAVIMLVVNGISYMSTESFSEKASLKEKFLGPIIGLFIALGSYALLNTINPALLGGEGLTVDQVTAQVDDEVETAPQNTYSNTGDTKACTDGFVDVLTSGAPGRINVCKSIATNLGTMITKAASQGVILSGYGSRSTQTQAQLRVIHGCPNITTPSTQCKPPTARPGHSMHERGLAIDFICNGKSMVDAGGQNSPCFKWLAANASTYGFRNLASESWHWSTTGK